MNEACYIRWLNRQVDGFVKVWAFMAKQGLCDSSGSVEFYRVFHEWMAHELPDPVCLFILNEANSSSKREHVDAGQPSRKSSSHFSQAGDDQAGDDQAGDGVAEGGGA